MNNFVTFVVPVFNGLRHIDNFLESAFCDDVCPELLFVDDASDDGSYEKLCSYSDVYPITVIRNKVNSGQFVARLNGIRHAESPYVICVDIDDIMDFKAAIKYVENNVLSGGDSVHLLKLFYRREDGSISNGPSVDFLIDSPLLTFDLNSPRWLFSTACVIDRKRFVNVFCADRVYPYNFDEYAGRFYLTLFSRIIQSDVPYVYNIFGGSLSRTFSPKRLTYYHSPYLIQAFLKEYNVPYKKNRLFLNNVVTLVNDVRAIFALDVPLVRKPFFLIKITLIFFHAAYKLYSFR